MTYLIGDIGNTETKLCVLDKKFKIIKRLNVDTLKIKNQYYFKKIIFSFVKNKIIENKSLFSSVVPSVFFSIKKVYSIFSFCILRASEKFYACAHSTTSKKLLKY